MFQEWLSQTDEVARHYCDDIHLTTSGNVAEIKSDPLEASRFSTTFFGLAEVGAPSLVQALK